MSVSYNASGQDGLPSIVVPGSVWLTGGSLRTAPERPQALRMRQRYANGFVQTVPFGKSTVRIRWRGYIESYNASMLERFVADLERYVDSGGRYVLIDEHGLQRSYVELVGIDSEDAIPQAVSSGGERRVRMPLSVMFEDMQPA